MTLVADSGSTKTDWRLGGQAFRTAGINPVRDSRQAIGEVVAALPDADVGEVHFYGAGCIPPYAEAVKCALLARYPHAQVRVESDMLGAARALCGHGEGIACILGTGSNSCLYDGERIVRNVPPLGYILGDEGGGASLGRILVGDLLKDQLGKGLRDKFLAHFRLTTPDIMDRVYRQPQPNRFLASLVPFLVDNREDEAIHALIVGELRRFFRRNVAQYRRPNLPAHFVGGVAHGLADELREAAAQEGFAVGIVLMSPISMLADYHQGSECGGALRIPQGDE